MQNMWMVAAILCSLTSLYIWYLGIHEESYIIFSGVAAMGFLASFYLWHRSELFHVRVSPYVFSGGAMVFFLACFYLWYTGPFLAVVALVHAYRTIGGIDWLTWLMPVVIELAFWPRLLIDALSGYAFPYPPYDLRALIYPPLFIAGLLLARRRYATQLRSQRSI